MKLITTLQLELDHAGTSHPAKVAQKLEAKPSLV
jgi:hypothetical protein